jgi:hypothetical protein
MTACSDRDLSLRFSGKGTSTRTFLAAASGAEIGGILMREGKRYPCKHCRGRRVTREECRRRVLAKDPGCRPGDTLCALGQLAAAGEAA